MDKRIDCPNCKGKGTISLGIKQGVCPECSGNKYILSDTVEETNDRLRNLLADLNDRNLRVSSFICEDSDSKLILISYDENGLVNFLSDKSEVLNINRQNDNGSHTPIARIGRKV
jgi:hypothetical protein